MLQNVFLYSTRRQPVRMVCLALVIVFVTFAFVGRVSEYLLIRQETERLGSFYRSIGTLKGSDSAVSEAKAILSGSPYVGMVDQARYESAVLADMYNADATDNSEGLLRDDAVFYGTLEQSFAGTMPVFGGGETKIYTFMFKVDKVLAGYSEAIGEGDTFRLVSPVDYRTGAGVYTDLTEIYEGTEIGQRYLVRGVFHRWIPSCAIKSLDGKSSFLFERLAGKDSPWFYPVEPGQEADFSDPALAGLTEEIDVINSNQRALTAITSQDVGALAEVWQGGRKPYLVDGRWPDGMDNEQGARVCAITENFAKAKGLAVGDHLDMSLRDLYRCYYGCLYDPVDLERFGSIPESEVERYEIVGIFHCNSGVPLWLNKDYQPDYLFLPASVVPEDFEYGYLPGNFRYDEGAHNTDHFFLLTSPAVEHAFWADLGGKLEEMGVEVEILETGWDSFQNAAGPMEQSSLFSAAVFAGVLLAALSLTAFLYYRMRRGDFAKARALGLPARACGRQAALPLLLIGTAGTLAGSVLGWRYTQARAGETLRSLAEFGELSDGLSACWLAGLWAVCFALLAGLAAVGAALLARRPVLSLLQGGAVQKIAKKQESASSVQAAEIDLSLLGQVIGSAPAARKGSSAAHILRFVWRHIWRMPVKSGLAVALAAGFVVGLSAIQLAIADSGERIDTLYNSTVVTLDLVQEGLIGMTIKESGSGPISTGAVQCIQETGFIQDAYLEGANEAAILPYDGEWVRGRPVSLRAPGMVRTRATSFDDLSQFLAESKSELEVTFLDGWEETLFAQDWVAVDAGTSDEDPALFPVILPEVLYTGYGLQPGDTIGVALGDFRLCEVAGYYEGSARGFDVALLLPNSVAEAMAGERMHYLQAHFELDPSRNRELDQFRAKMARILDENRGMSLRALLWDEELKQAVEPLEDSVVLMRLLYPAAIVLSILVAAGVSTLFVMLSAKEAAILRVQGTTKLRMVLMLSMQQVFTCFAGLAAGLTGTLFYIGGTRPDLFATIIPGEAVCAGLYLTAGIVGAAASSVVAARKNPLEMLQVKE